MAELFRSYTKPVVIAFLIMIVASLINIFILKSPMAHVYYRLKENVEKDRNK